MVNLFKCVYKNATQILAVKHKDPLNACKLAKHHFNLKIAAPCQNISHNVQLFLVQ